MIEPAQMNIYQQAYIYDGKGYAMQEYLFINVQRLQKVSEYNCDRIFGNETVDSATGS